MKLKDYFKNCYMADPEKAVSDLMDDTFVAGMGWKRVFHEGIGDGIYNPEEGVVAVYDEDDLEEYHEYHFYRYRPEAWIITDNGGLDDVYAGNNGSMHGVDIEPLD